MFSPQVLYERLAYLFPSFIIYVPDYLLVCPEVGGGGRPTPKSGFEIFFVLRKRSQGGPGYYRPGSFPDPVPVRPPSPDDSRCTRVRLVGPISALSPESYLFPDSRFHPIEMFPSLPENKIKTQKINKRLFIQL